MEEDIERNPNFSSVTTTQKEQELNLSKENIKENQLIEHYKSQIVEVVSETIVGAPNAEEQERNSANKRKQEVEGLMHKQAEKIEQLNKKVL